MLPARKTVLFRWSGAVNHQAIRTYFLALGTHLSRMESVSVRSVEVPALGFGTARLTGDACRDAVAHALELGYRHIDTAQMYDNEAAVGDAIATASVDRDEIFLVTKVHRRNLAYEDVLSSVQDSLDRLGTSIDLLLIHAPSRSVPVEESSDAMNQLQTEGRVEHIGVSNFSVSQLQEAIAASQKPILTNQVEYHPFTDQSDLLAFCIENDIMLTAYSPVAEGRVIGNDTLRTIGQTYGKSEAQVALRWLLQQDCVAAIPKAATRQHRQENLDLFDFELTDEEMRDIFDLHGGIVTRIRRALGL
jgi:2,5-diketo-D-gluconate reductase B